MAPTYGPCSRLGFYLDAILPGTASLPSAGPGSGHLQGLSYQAWEGPNARWGAASPLPFLHPQPALCSRGCQISGRVTHSTSLLTVSPHQASEIPDHSKKEAYLFPWPFLPPPSSPLASQEARGKDIHAPGGRCRPHRLPLSSAYVSATSPEAPPSGSTQWKHGPVTLALGSAWAEALASSPVWDEKKQETWKKTDVSSGWEKWLWTSMEGPGRLEKTGLGCRPWPAPWTNLPSSAMSLSSTSLPCRRKLRMGPK